MHVQAEFYQVEKMDANSGDRAVLERQRTAALQAVAALMNVYGIIELRLTADVQFVFPDYKITMFHVPDIDTPQALLTAAAFIVPSAIKPLMVSWGISQVTLEYTQDDIAQMRDHMRSITTGEVSESRFESVRMSPSIDPAPPNDAPVSDTSRTLTEASLTRLSRE